MLSGFLRWAAALTLILLSLFSCRSEVDLETVLTKEELAWLAENRDSLTFAVEESYPPFVFVSNDGTLQGLSIDYLEEFERMLGFKFRRSEPDDFHKHLKSLKEGQLDFISSIKKTDKRTDFLLFTDSYIEVPVLILTKKNRQLNISIESLQGVNIAVGKDYSIHEYLNTHYPELNVIPAENDLDGLEMLAFEEVEVFLGDMAVCSYYVEKLGITKIKVTGYSDFVYDLSFATREDLPELAAILNKLLSAIPAAKKEEIRRRWISLDVTPFYKTRTFIFTLSLLSFILLLIMAWNLALNHMVKERTVELKSYKDHLEELVKERTEALTKSNRELELSIKKVKILSGFLPICAACKKIRDEDGTWHELEYYITNHSQAEFSHSICPDCAQKLYGDIPDEL